MTIHRPPECDECPLNPTSDNFNGNKGGFVPPHDGKDPVLKPGGGSWENVDLLVVGYYPAEDEEMMQEPMMGPSTFDWRRALAEYKRVSGIKRVRKLNVCNCRTTAPGKTKKLINRDPTALELKSCAIRWLVPELKACNKSVNIVTLGKEAYNYVFGEKQYGKFKESRGNRVEPDISKRDPALLAASLEKRLGKVKKETTVWRHCKCGRLIRKPKRKCTKCVTKKTKQS